MAGPVDFDDPSTWPKDYDVDGLAALAESSEDESTEEDTEKAVPQAAKAEAKAEEATPEEPNKQEAQASQEQAKDEPQGGQETADLSADEAEGVYAKDGKHILPFEVVAELRRKNKDLNDQLAQLQASATPKENKETPQGTQETPQDEDRDPLDMTEADLALSGEALNARLNEIEAEYGRAQRNQWKHLLEAKQELRAIRDREQQSLEAQQRTVEEQVQEAIDNNPVLLAWQQDSESPWYQRANQMHQFLMSTDPNYPAASIADQMAILVEKTEALHGTSPHREKIKAVGDKPAKTKETPKAERKTPEKAQDELPVPTSLSTIPGGTPPDVSPAETLEKMTPRQIQAHMDKLASDPDKLNAFLAGL